MKVGTPSRKCRESTRDLPGRHAPGARLAAHDTPRYTCSHTRPKSSHCKNSTVFNVSFSLLKSQREGERKPVTLASDNFRRSTNFKLSQRSGLMLAHTTILSLTVHFLRIVKALAHLSLQETTVAQVQLGTRSIHQHKGYKVSVHLYFVQLPFSFVKKKIYLTN